MTKEQIIQKIDSAIEDVYTLCNELADYKEASNVSYAVDRLELAKEHLNTLCLFHS
jgi:hypothetical protein